MSMNKIIMLLTSGLIKNVTFILGAGISTNSGIPDYRSHDGMYNTVNLEELRLTEKQLKRIKHNPGYLVDKELFEVRPDILNTIKKDFIMGNYKPTIAHAFLAILEEKGMLYSVITQNIDGLELQLVNNHNNINQIHGSIKKARCHKCKQEMPFEEFKNQLEINPAVKCKIENCKGYIRPDIVLYGENIKMDQNSSRYHYTDLLIVSGTSLQVYPVAEMPDNFLNNQPKFNINGEKLETIENNILGDCDKIYLEIIYNCGWFNNLLKLKDKLCIKSQSLIMTYVTKPIPILRPLKCIILSNSMYYSLYIENLLIRKNRLTKTIADLVNDFHYYIIGIVDEILPQTDKIKILRRENGYTHDDINLVI